MIQIVQALWGSWGKDAWVANPETGEYAKADEIAPVNLGGKHIASRGPLYIPPTEQGQPVIFHAGGPSPNALNIAGRYASGFIAGVFSVDDAREQRAAFREATKQAGRDPEEFKFIPGLMTSIAKDKRAALDRRIALCGPGLDQKAPYLQQMLVIHFDFRELDKPLNKQQLAGARASDGDPRAVRALEVAQEGWSPRDILAHGVIDYQLVVAGTATDVADHMQEWFEAGAADGFWVSPDAYHDGIDDFVDGVVPILQDRGLFHLDYEGTTLRDHLGVPDQYGIDPRVTG